MNLRLRLVLVIACSIGISETSVGDGRLYGDYDAAPGIRFNAMAEEIVTGQIGWNMPVAIDNGVSFPEHFFSFSSGAPIERFIGTLFFGLTSNSGIRALVVDASGVYSASGGNSVFQAHTGFASFLQVKINGINGVPTDGPYLTDMDDKQLRSSGESHADIPWAIKLVVELDPTLELGQHVTSAQVTIDQDAWAFAGDTGASSVRTDHLTLTVIALPEPTTLRMVGLAGCFLVRMVRPTRAAA